MLTRIISALIAIPLLFFIVVKNGIFLKVSVLIVAILGLHEFYNAFKNINLKPSKLIGFISILFIFLITFKTTDAQTIMLWFFINMILILCSSLLHKESNITSSVITAFGIHYIVFFIYHVVFIANLQDNSQLIWLIFITAWGTDTFAYFIGFLFGKNKLCPSISPKKTVEGAIGGILGSTMLSFLFMYAFKPHLLFHGLIIGFIGSIIAQMGDLTASIVKRYVGIKDYGKIMPGHGGILDRFDSILFTAPLVYYYITFFIN